MSHILGSNFLSGATILSSGADASYPAANMVDGRTNTQAGFLAGATRVVVFDLGIAKESDAIGIAKHNLGTVGATVFIETSPDNSNWWSRFTLAFTNDAVRWARQTPSQTHRYVRVSISGHSGTAYISDLTFGKNIETTTGQPIGYVAPYDGFKTQVISNVTRGNELAGLTLVSRPKEFKIHIEKVAREDFDAFADLIYSAVTDGPFYFKWATLTSSDGGIDGKSAFCWLKTMPQAKYDGTTTRGIVIDCMGFTE